MARHLTALFDVTTIATIQLPSHLCMIAACIFVIVEGAFWLVESAGLPVKSTPVNLVPGQISKYDCNVAWG